MPSQYASATPRQEARRGDRCLQTPSSRSAHSRVFLCHCGRCACPTGRPDPLPSPGTRSLVQALPPPLRRVPGCLRATLRRHLRQIPRPPHRARALGIPRLRRLEPVRRPHRGRGIPWHSGAPSAASTGFDPSPARANSLWAGLYAASTPRSPRKELSCPESTSARTCCCACPTDRRCSGPP
jgi:hypothetical protein